MKTFYKILLTVILTPGAAVGIVVALLVAGYDGGRALVGVVVKETYDG